VHSTMMAHCSPNRQTRSWPHSETRGKPRSVAAFRTGGRPPLPVGSVPLNRPLQTLVQADSRLPFECGLRVRLDLHVFIGRNLVRLTGPHLRESDLRCAANKITNL